MTDFGISSSSYRIRSDYRFVVFSCAARPPTGERVVFVLLRSFILAQRPRPHARISEAVDDFSLSVLLLFGLLFLRFTDIMPPPL